ncbi:MAG: ATP-grasp domain-containing protein, partial [Candidatus Methanomethylophilaceae archaeon]|nr:ATP-grasp domain-containing protein [Candidatus Methanomethylophilaceae archaeon]
YDGCDLENNRFFAERLCRYGNMSGYDTQIVLSEELDPEDAPDIVVSRSRNLDVITTLEEYGSTVYNRSSVSRICNDKSATYTFVQNLGIPCLDWSFGDISPPGPPWIVKSCIGHGGKEVHKVDDVASAIDLIQSMHDRKPIIQKMAGDAGKDLRVYVLGGRILASVMRSSDSDFRANFTLGGRAELHDVPDDAMSIIKKIVPELLPDFIGIDFVFDENGKAYLNEIEDVVGTRMLYELTDLDPARVYMEYITHSKISL